MWDRQLKIGILDMLFLEQGGLTPLGCPSALWCCPSHLTWLLSAALPGGAQDHAGMHKGPLASCKWLPCQARQGWCLPLFTRRDRPPSAQASAFLPQYKHSTSFALLAREIPQPPLTSCLSVPAACLLSYFPVLAWVRSQKLGTETAAKCPQSHSEEFCL